MTSKRMWFGTRGFETWVPSPSINPDYGRAGWDSGVQQFTNGQAGYRGSKSAHNTYSLSWGPTNSSEAIRPITDFADGIFDGEDDVNLIYWIDPMARDKNVLPQAMAVPSLGCEDAPPLVTSATGFGRPIAVATPANRFRYPARGARFSMDPDSITYSQYIPIPPGYSAWVGVHGDGDNIMQVRRVRGKVDQGTPILLRNIGLDARQVNTEVDSTEASGIVLEFAPVTSRRVFTLYGLVVQILRTGERPVGTTFISGQGHSGCQFVGKPSKTPYSAFYDRVALTARLEETGMGR